ncbi:hypothetical protein FJZ53_05935 [Candidatus Woesearchaeota archaeon]|nr:hypothetical protein [Candidatus Woesearchaeota archaeon]
MLKSDWSFLKNAFRRVVSDVSRPELAFWFCNGRTARNIQELVDGIKFSPDSVFYNHVSTNKDDFAKWILDVLGDNVLTASLQNIKSKEAYVMTIEDRIEEINQKLVMLQYRKD